jgi:outer membrane protein OmpA-like peptidoglycan-associated protein
MAAAEPEVLSAEQISRKWKRTKSLAAPVEKIRKGMTAVAAAGLQSVEVRVDADTGLAFQNIQFERDKAELLEGATRAQIAEIARAMKQAGGESFLIEGHTCDLGSGAHNLRLSHERAQAVKSELERHGVESGRLQVLGFGESDPVVANSDEAARAKNRRVQIYRRLEPR